MSTKKKPTATDGLNELDSLRVQVLALSRDLALRTARVEALETKHDKLLAELRRRASGLPVLADLVSVALRMHGKDTAGRTVLQAIEKAIAEMRAFAGTDSLPGREESSPTARDLASYADGEAPQTGSYVFRGSEKVPA